MAWAAFLAYVVATRAFGNDVEPMAYVIMAVAGAAVLWVVGIVARWGVKLLATPSA